MVEMVQEYKYPRDHLNKKVDWSTYSGYMKVNSPLTMRTSLYRSSSGRRPKGWEQEGPAPFQGQQSSGQRSQMSFQGSAGATPPVLGSLTRVLQLPRGPLLSNFDHSKFQTMLSTDVLVYCASHSVMAFLLLCVGSSQGNLCTACTWGLLWCGRPSVDLTAFVLSFSQALSSHWWDFLTLDTFSI